jgi:hypothetical protein
MRDRRPRSFAGNVDETGNVVGVVVAKLDAVAVANETGDLPQNVNFAVSPAMLQAFLSDYGVKHNAPIVSFKQSSETIAKKLQSASFLIHCY